jgi:uncharacterized protein
MTQIAQAWRDASDGILVRVRVTPKAARDGVEGLEETAEGPALKVRVRAVPEDGAANRAVAEVVAKWLGVPKRTVVLVGGARSRIKTLSIIGEPHDLASRFEALSS